MAAGKTTEWRLILRPRRRRDEDVAALMAWALEHLMPLLEEEPPPVDVELEFARGRDRPGWPG